ncbi:MAG: alpha/beta fold hydrolase [Solirubrobacteraceae bacterium]
MSEPSWSAERLGPASGTPLVVFIHGGFWRARWDASTTREIARRCATELDVAAWNMEYPRIGMDGGGWPGTGAAVRSGVAAALQEASTDGRPVALVGHSAGGQLALWAAAELPSVALTVALAGVCDLRAAYAEGLGSDAVAELFGGREPTDAEYTAASPIERLPLGVPSLLIHGDNDDRVPLSQSISFAGTAGSECTFEQLRRAGHFDVIDPHGPAWPALSEALRGLAAD